MGLNIREAQRTKLKYNIPSVIWMVILAFLMLLPSKNIPDVKVFSYDKLGHLGVFAILFLLLAWGFTKQYKNEAGNKSTYIALTISIVYSTALELLQKFIPGRAFDLYDIIANSSGIFTGLIIFLFLNKK